MDDPEKTEEGQEEESEGQQTEGQEAEGKAEGEAEDELKTVPYDRFEEVVKQVKALEAQVGTANQQLALARANPSQVKAPAAPQFDIYKEVGLDPNDPEDIPNQGQLKKIMGHYATVYDTQLANIAFLQAHPDYTELVGTADECASGQYAAPLAAALKDNPALINMITNSPNPCLAAYGIAKLQKNKAPGKPVKEDEAKEVIEEAARNAGRVKSSANAKGGGALSEEARYAKMNNADFLKLAHTRGAIV